MNRQSWRIIGHLPPPPDPPLRPIRQDATDYPHEQSHFIIRLSKTPSAIDQHGPGGETGRSRLQPRRLQQRRTHHYANFSDFSHGKRGTCPLYLFARVQEGPCGVREVSIYRSHVT